MPSVATRLLSNLYHGSDPYAGFPSGLFAVDMQGWNSAHPYLGEAITQDRPTIVVEVGVWKGGSTITMAKSMKDQGIDGCVIAVDTWLGSWDHWTHKEYFDRLRLVNGRSQLMLTFMQNVIASDVKDWVAPLPLDSVNAFEVIRHRKIVPDIVHLDAGHDYRAVIADLEMWWSVLRPGGLLIGDDYKPEGGWVEVRKAFDEFFTPLGLYPIENLNNKCRVRKPART